MTTVNIGSCQYWYLLSFRPQFFTKNGKCSSFDEILYFTQNESGEFNGFDIERCKWVPQRNKTWTIKTNVESLSIEILFHKERNTLINVLYRPLKGVIEPFERFLKEILKKAKDNLKPFHIAGDFYLNILDHDKCSKVHNVLNLLYENGMIPIINKPARVTRKTATAIDHILTNQFININFKTAIFKTDRETC